MSWNSRVLDTWIVTFLDQGIAMTNATGFHLDADLAAVGVGNISLDKVEATTRFSYLYRFHTSHFFFSFENVK